MRVMYKRLVSQANNKLCFSQIKYIFFWHLSECNQEFVTKNLPHNVFKLYHSCHS